MKKTVTVSAVSHKHASEKYIRDGLAKLSSRFTEIHFALDDQQPDVLLFLSGGSEQTAIKRLSPGRFTLLLASSEGNAFASAMEVKAWASAQHIPARILSLDDANAETQLLTYARVFSGLQKLRGKRAGLIGDVSHWLVASALDPKLVKDRLGIDILHLPWSKIPSYLDYLPHPEFLEVFAHHDEKTGIPGREDGSKDTQNRKAMEKDTSGPKEDSGPWQKEAAVYAFLLDLIRDHHLDALTLECFDMVNDHHVTACLSLALLNSKGLPAGCEGDLVSLAGMMLAGAVTGQIPWMANVASMNENSVLFAHCTAPLDLLEDFAVDTHFETDKSAAIAGHIQPSEVTVFRLDQKLEKAFVSRGNILSRPAYRFACRTQTEVAMDAEAIRCLKEDPLGNHHLILPGDQVALLRAVCQVKDMKVV